MDCRWWSGEAVLAERGSANQKLQKLVETQTDRILANSGRAGAATLHSRCKQY